ncbi:hypothetical protein [Rhizobium glycinendophyticum]|uniref:Head-tail adaptor protein n=1 Tax=Rhizobium glycinendophyticum TaxID=2589807 RepID=A0A504UNV6_9HYPH|nr:hypothetical protein [Rhizobium glycinendophyticum]TPP07022.1 hypothetical protein FJQ55_15280 [Rhizobium glycinendophyticum]
MAIFDRLDRMISKTVDRQFSVRATVYPMAQNPNGRPALDPSRSTIDLKGVFDQMPTYDAIETGKRERSGNDLHTLATGMSFDFSFDVKRHPYADDIRQGDALSLDDGRRFDVVSVERDGLSRAVLRLVKL